MLKEHIEYNKSNIEKYTDMKLEVISSDYVDWLGLNSKNQIYFKHKLDYELSSNKNINFQLKYKYDKSIETFIEKSVFRGEGGREAHETRSRLSTIHQPTLQVDWRGLRESQVRPRFRNGIFHYP